MVPKDHSIKDFLIQWEQSKDSKTLLILTSYDCPLLEWNFKQILEEKGIKVNLIAGLRDKYTCAFAGEFII